MSQVYVDSSVVVAIEFAEPGANEVAGWLTDFERIVSSPLLEAEVRSALAREQRLARESLFSSLSWVTPQAELSEEIGLALSVGYLRGADLWHVACALYAADAPGEQWFATLDQSQAAVAGGLGFRVFPDATP